MSICRDNQLTHEQTPVVVDVTKSSTFLYCACVFVCPSLSLSLSLACCVSCRGRHSLFFIFLVHLENAAFLVCRASACSRAQRVSVVFVTHENTARVAASRCFFWRVPLNCSSLTEEQYSYRASAKRPPMPPVPPPLPLPRPSPCACVSVCGFCLPRPIRPQQQSKGLRISEEPRPVQRGRPNLAPGQQEDELYAVREWRQGHIRAVAISALLARGTQAAPPRQEPRHNFHNL